MARRSIGRYQWIGYVSVVKMQVFRRINFVFFSLDSRLDRSWNRYRLCIAPLDLHGCHWFAAWHIGSWPIAGSSSIPVAWTVGPVWTCFGVVGWRSIVRSILLCCRRGRSTQPTWILFRIDFHALGWFDCTRFWTYDRHFAVQNAQSKK